MAGFFEHFGIIPDPRGERGKKHKLLDILFIALCTVLSGGETFTDMSLFAKLREEWLRKYIELPGGIPSHDTFRRVLGIIAPGEFMDCFAKWTEGIRRMSGGKVIAFDGKTLRHSFDTWSGTAAIHLVSAWVTEVGLALGYEKVASKSNEISALLALLEKLDLKGYTVTIDAMGCQKEIAAKIIDRGGDYLLCVKGNQGNLFEDLKEFFADCGDFKGIEHSYYDSVEKDHGRIEVRTCRAIEGEAPWLGIDKEWKGVRTIAMIQRSRTIRDKTSEETSYYITSLPAKAKQIALAARSHWKIENSQHWVLDVTMNEDMCRVRKDNAAENLAILRRIAISMVNLVKGKMSVRASIKQACWDTSFLEAIFVGT